MSAEVLKEGGEIMRSKGYDAEAIVLDVTNSKAVAEAARKSNGRHGGVDILVANAGIAWPDTGGEETHGAGDEFIGVLAAEIASGKTMNDALKKANMDAAKLVGTPETDRLG